MPEEEATAIAERLNDLHRWCAYQPWTWENCDLLESAQKCAINLVAASGYHLVFIVQPDFCGYQARK